MFAYPKQAVVNRVIPKTRIYAHSKASKRIKELFVAQVGEVLWTHKLSPETVRLPARHGIEEIQVVQVMMRTPDLDPAILPTIDKAIPFPLVFIVIHEKHVRFAAPYKRPSQTDTAKWVTSGIFQTSLHPIDTTRHPLPVALDLAHLYEHLVCRHIPLAARAGERIDELVTRYQALEAKHKLHQQLQKKITQEKQFNRRVELNRQLRDLARELADLR